MGRTNYFLNELGVALIFPNVRGSTRLRQDLRELDNGMKREDSVKDIGALLDWIARAAGLDAGARDGHRRQLRRLHDAGHGDQLQRPHPLRRRRRRHLRTSVTFLKNTESYRRDLRRVEYGDERDPQMRHTSRGSRR